MAVMSGFFRPKVAFITGITGQDGSYLSEILLEKGYEVHGLVRSSASRREALNRPLRPRLTIHFGDMSDVGRLVQILGNIKADEIYHLAAQSHVAVSFDTPIQTNDTNAMGTLRLLEAMRMLGMDRTTKFYNACSSEVFGSDMPAPQTEETPFHPVSPYAVSKQFQYWITVNFREAYGFHASNGLLFNHESPRRGTTFVTRKITTQVALIACGQLDSFQLGNLDAVRDWGHAKDYMQGVYLMLQQPVGGDYALASGQAHSIRDFVEAAFRVIGVKIEWSGTGLDEVGVDSVSGKIRVKVHPDFYRPLDNQNLLGSAAKAKRVLGWTPTYTFEALVEEMVLCDIEAVNTGRIFSNSNLDWVVGESQNAESLENGIVSNGHKNGPARLNPFGEVQTLAVNDERSSDGAEKISLTDVRSETELAT
ncbi:GDP-mannose 4,6-dehydratase [Trichoderma afarasin]